MSERTKSDLVSCLRHLELRLQRLDNMLAEDNEEDEEEVAIETDLEVCGKIVRSLFRHLSELSREDARRIRHAELTWCRISLAAIERSLMDKPSTNPVSSPTTATITTTDMDRTLKASSSSSSSSDEYDWDDECRYLSERQYEESVDEAEALRLVMDCDEDYRNFIDSDDQQQQQRRRRRRRRHRHQRQQGGYEDSDENEQHVNLVTRENGEKLWLDFEQSLKNVLNNEDDLDHQLITELRHLESICGAQSANLGENEEKLRWNRALKSIRFVSKAIDISSALNESVANIKRGLIEVKEDNEDKDAAMIRLSGLKARLLDLNLGVHSVLNRLRSHLNTIFVCNEIASNSESSDLRRFLRLKNEVLRLYAEWDEVFVAISMRNNESQVVLRRHNNNNKTSEMDKDCRRDSAFVEFEPVSESSSSGFCTDNDPMSISEQSTINNDTKSNESTVLLQSKSSNTGTKKILKEDKSVEARMESDEIFDEVEPKEEMMSKSSFWPDVLKRGLRMALPIQCLLSTALLATFAVLQPRCCDLSVFGATMPIVQINYPHGPPPI